MLDQPSLTVRWSDDRICAPYRDAHERRAAWLPFLLQGLAEGASAAYLLTSPDDEVCAELTDDLRPWGEGARMEVLRLPGAMWEVPQPVATWTGLLSSITAALPRPTRIVVDLSWPGSAAPDASVLAPFQRAVDKVADGALGAMVMCLYDVRSITGAALLEVLRTSRPRRLLVGHTLLDNPYATADLAPAT